MCVTIAELKKTNVDKSLLINNKTNMQIDKNMGDNEIINQNLVIDKLEKHQIRISTLNY